MKTILLPALLILTILGPSGCSVPNAFGDTDGSSYQPEEKIKDANLIKATHHAGEQLIRRAGYLRDKLDPIIITSIANIVEIDSSSALGLTISEQIGDRFAQYGFPVVDIRQRKDIKIRQETGEFMLSRDIKKISTQHAASAILLGTYAQGSDHVFVSTRLVRPNDSRVLAAYDFELPLGPDTKRLVNTITKQED